MNYALYRELMRRKMLEDIYARMSDDERRQLQQYLLQRNGHQEVMTALGQQRAQIESIARKIEGQGWLTDFGSDVAANFLTDGLIWLARRLFRRH